MSTFIFATYPGADLLSTQIQSQLSYIGPVDSLSLVRIKQEYTGQISTWNKTPACSGLECTDCLVRLAPARPNDCACLLVYQEWQVIYEVGNGGRQFFASQKTLSPDDSLSEIDDEVRYYLEQHHRDSIYHGCVMGENNPYLTVYILLFSQPTLPVNGGLHATK